MTGGESYPSGGPEQMAGKRPDVPNDQQAILDSADSGLFALASIASHYRIAADPFQLKHELGLGANTAEGRDIVRAAKKMGLKAQLRSHLSISKLRTIPLPAILQKTDGSFCILVSRDSSGQFVVADAVRRLIQQAPAEAVERIFSGNIILVTRRFAGTGVNPQVFSFRWFLPSLWRYRKPLAVVLVASLFVQLFALVTPLFFQIVIDKVLVHRGISTLVVIIIGLVGIGLFDVTLQYLRSYVLNHTSSRIDVELGARLFDHLLRLPLAYFETRPTGQTVARVRELETIRSFLTGQGLLSAIDLLFIVVFIAVLLAYSPLMTLVVLLSFPLYLIVGALIRPPLRDKISQRFNTGAASQQFLVESIVGVQTLKASAVEPILRNEWEDRLAAYVKTSFQASMLSNAGQNAIQYISKATTAAVLFVGAEAVMSGKLTVGALVAFNMIMTQAIAPIMRLSQLWQDFQQIQISVQRLGDILNNAPESENEPANLPAAEGAIKISNLSFRYGGDTPDVLRNLDLEIGVGEVIGIVGRSGSGKSTLTKLLQRLYRVDRGQILMDGMDIAQVNTAWLRRQIGVVLQENMLFNRTIHENIALANPAMPRGHVIAVARLAGADEFIAKLQLGYDTKIEERGANLSGGQRQRIAIARALATQPRVLILDEATSALDYESERIVQASMRQIAQGRTVIIIAHRLSAVRQCDRIIALENGRICEEGTHDDLVARPGGLYAKLWRMQVEDSRG